MSSETSPPNSSEIKSNYLTSLNDDSLIRAPAGETLEGRVQDLAIAIPDLASPRPAGSSSPRASLQDQIREQSLQSAAIEDRNAGLKQLEVESVLNSSGSSNNVSVLLVPTPSPAPSSPAASFHESEMNLPFNDYAQTPIFSMRRSRLADSFTPNPDDDDSPCTDDGLSSSTISSTPWSPSPSVSLSNRAADLSTIPSSEPHTPKAQKTDIQTPQTVVIPGLPANDARSTLTPSRPATAIVRDTASLFAQIRGPRPQLSSVKDRQLWPLYNLTKSPAIVPKAATTSTKWSTPEGEVSIISASIKKDIVAQHKGAQNASTKNQGTNDDGEWEDISLNSSPAVVRASELSYASQQRNAVAFATPFIPSSAETSTSRGSLSGGASKGDEEDGLEDSAITPRRLTFAEQPEIGAPVNTLQNSKHSEKSALSSSSAVRGDSIDDSKPLPLSIKDGLAQLLAERQANPRRKDEIDHVRGIANNIHLVKGPDAK